MSRVLVTHGARAAEALLLERLDGLLDETARDPTLLATPIRVVVPSSSLRDHLLARLVAPRRGRARSLAGLTVQTLFTLAAEIVERSRDELPLGERLFEILAQREARREPSLRAVLEGLADGFGSVAGTIRDLIDAGLEPIHGEAAEEALRSDGSRLFGPGPVERAAALVRSAARTEERMGRLGRGRRSSLLRLAAERLAEGQAGPEDPEGRPDPLPARALFIHGFADATGLAADLLQTLIRRRGAEAILDRPPQPAGPGFESAFVDRFAARFLFAAPFEEAEPAALSLPLALRAFEAAGVDAEVREAARRLHALLAAGTRPEGIGVVARDLTPYRFALARHFGRLGLPFHAPGTAGALPPSGRRLGALLELLGQGEGTPTDRWLDAQRPAEPGAEGGAPDVDLRLALLSLGAARLRDVAALPVDLLLRRPTLPLPLRQGLDADASDLEGGAEAAEPSAVRPTRRGVPSQEVRRLVQRAGRLRRHLEDWPRRAPFAAHARALRTLLGEGLGWRPGDDESRRVEEALGAASAEIPAGFELDRDELQTLLDRLLRDGAASPLGGAGGGLQLLSVTEARGRTFEHLFVLGLHRNSFPRVVRQDPLLPDDLRGVLQRVLPDLPLKLAGFDEERYLFAQLLSAAPEVVLSWQYADDDGKPQPPSPLVDRLRGAIRVERAPALWSPASARAPLTAGERATCAGLAATGGRESFARRLRPALAEARGLSLRQPLPPSLEALAAGRIAVLSELDPDLRSEGGRAVRARLGPYFGFVGAVDPRARCADPRRRTLYVTHLESLAGCPWQLFLERLLGIEPAPDPTGLLPGLDPSLLGRTVHAVLEAIGKEALAGRGEGMPERESSLPVLADWPAPAALSVLSHETAGNLLAEEGIYLAGLAGALTRQALPYLEVARRLDWGEGPLPLLGLEEEGEIEARSASGALHPVRFRADRVDLASPGPRDGPKGAAAGGVRRWTDYKTGRPLSDSKREETRRRHFLAKVRAGTHLQAVAYLLGAEVAESAGMGGRGGVEPLGRYLFLDPAIASDEIRELAVRPGDAPFRAAFDRALAALLESWETGSLFPRLVELNGREEPPRCARCAVAEACLRGDSGARRRLHDWTVGPEAAGATGAEGALLRTWRLALAPEAEGVRSAAADGGDAAGSETP